MKKIKFIFLILNIFICTGLFAQENDWAQWRGPDANGTSAETNWNPKAILNKDAVLWETNVGMGHSAVSVVNERLYTFGNWEVSNSVFKDKVYCLDARTGKQIWSYSYECAEKEDPGPFTSPLVDDERLYTLSREGDFYCFDINDGTVIWYRDIVSEGLSKEGEFCGSPIAYNDLIILNINRSGAAFNKKTGELVWNSPHATNGFSTPVFYKSDGKNVMVIQAMDDTYAIIPESGEVYWHLNKGSIPDPFIVGNKLLQVIHKGFYLYDIAGDKPESIWHNSD